MRRAFLAALVALAASCGSKSSPAVTGPEAEAASEVKSPAQDVCANPFETREGNVFLLEADARVGPAGPRFSDNKTSRQQPLEVCRVNQQLDLLTELRCDNGAPAFESRDAAHAARMGSVRSAGRCQVPVDVYRVPCPEKTYELHIDIYMCALAELDERGPYLTRFVDAGYTAVIPISTLPARTPWGLVVQGDNYIVLIAGDLDPSTPFDDKSALATLRKTMNLTVEAPVKTTTEGFERRSAYPATIGETALEVVELTSPAAKRVVMLARRADDTKVAALEAKLGEIARGFVANQHRYLSEKELFTARGDELKIAVNEEDGSSYAYPEGWSVVYTSKDHYVARTETADGALSFIMQRFPRQSPSVEPLTDLLRRWLRDEVNTLHHRSETAVLVEDEDSFNMTMVVPAGDVFVVGTLTGAPEAFRANDAALLLKTLVAMNQGFIEGEKAP